ALFEGRPVNEPLRLWIAGCSSGEEAYSIVICLHEYLGERAAASKIQVFATDISEIAIAKARTGMYKKSEMTGFSASRLQKFFSSKDGSFLLNKSIRDTCVFAYHNFLKDPPFARIDLISCRNSLIYMEPNLQKKALTTFHYSLNGNGFLLLGKSETTSQAADLFNVFEKNSKIYKRKAVKERFLHEIPEHKQEIFREGKFGSTRNDYSKDDFQKNADEVLISKYSPPGVVVNNELDIVEFRGATEIWLEPSSGKPNLNVLKMAREELSFELRNILHKSKISKKAEVKEDIPIQFMGTEKLVTIEVIPLLNTLELHFLILFRDSSLPSGSARDQKKEIEPGALLPLNEDKILIQKLQMELAQNREDMKSITEYQEASNEELQSANEELLSGSEELQSLNQEMETVKEETQTSNEELIIVNQELYERNEQLNHSRLYAESIITTIREPLIILNKNLRVKSANKSFYTIFKTTAEVTEGKHLFELADKLWDIQELHEMMGKVLPEKASIVDYEVTLNLPDLGERTMLLNASTIFRDNSEEQLILLVAEDITEKRKIDKALHLFSEELEKQVAERTISLHEAIIELQYSNDNLEQFAYIASHDLQEPLRKIRTYSSLLKSRHKNDLHEGVKEMLTKIEASAERMSNLIKEVLNFSKILHHGGEAFVKTDLNVIINEVLNDFDLLINDKHAVIHLERLPVIDAIPVQITQLFYNLISNSLKFTKMGTSPVITITSKIAEGKVFGELTTLNPKLSYCEICIRDNGIGFDQKYADQIFLIFHRLHGREHYTGTGIGLALCKTIVVNHNGEIFGVSNKNEGASFKIILPLLQSKDQYPERLHRFFK
ncbi:MAG TPA: CheR family methyltransferase, partial [Puia sp.]